MIRGALSGLLVGTMRRRGASFGPGSGVGGGLSAALDLLFTSGTLDSRVTYTGASLATLTDATGAIAYKPHNLLTYSEDFTNATWSKIACSVTANATTDPDGTTTASYLVFSSAAGVRHYLSNPGSAASPASIAVYAKSDGSSFELMLGDNGTGSRATFNLTSGTVTSTSGATATITPVRSGWYLCQAYVPSGTLAANNWWIGGAAGGSQYFTGDDIHGVYIWRPRLNAGSSLQPYYPTTSAAYYGPRFTYDPVTHAALGLLIEEQRTNLLLQSGNVGGASWTTSGALTVTQNAVAGPMGGITATRIQTSGAASVYQNITVAASTAYAFTFYALNNGGTLAQYSVYDVTHAANIFAETTYLPSINGSTWTRVTVAFTSPAGCVSVNVYPIRATGSGVDLYLDCAQLEAGAFATSYIPTTSASVTRAADSATMTGSNFSSWFNATQGTFVVNGITPPAPPSVAVFVQVDSGAETEKMTARYYAAGNWFFDVYSGGGATQASLDTGSATANAPFKIAGSYALNAFAACRNGGAVISDSSGTPPTVNRLVIGCDGVQRAANAPISRLRYYNTALTNAQLQALTT